MIMAGNKLMINKNYFSCQFGKFERTTGLETEVDFSVQSTLNDVTHYFRTNADFLFDSIYHGFIRRGVRSRFFTDNYSFNGVCTGKVRRNAFSLESAGEPRDFLRIKLDDNTLVYVPIDSDGDVELNQEILGLGKKIYLASPGDEDVYFYELGLLGTGISFDDQVYIETSVDDFRKFFSSVEPGTCVGMTNVSNLIPHKLSYFTAGDPVGFNGIYLGSVKRRNAYGYASWYAKFWVFDGVSAFVPISDDDFIQVRQDL